MSASIKNLYQFRTTSKITQAQGASSTFTVWNDIFTNSAVSLIAWSIQLTNRTWSQIELFTVTVSAWVATIASRGIKPDGTTNSIYQYERPRNTLCTVTVLENQIFDKWGSETLTGNITYTWEVTYNWEVYFPSLTTAERDAITWNRDWAIIYNETTGTTQQRVWGSWSDIDTGTVTPNASGTVAGKVEIATQAEFDAGTATWWTGAQLTPTNDQIRKQISTATAKTTPVNADSIAISDSAASGVIKKTTLTEFKAASDMQATTTTSWFVELATDAEAATGTDETRYTNSKQLWLKNKTFITNITRVMNAASWSVVVAHWLWFTPKYITATAVNAWWNKATSEWSSDFTIHRCNSDEYNGNWSSITNTVTQQNALIYIKDTNSNWTNNFRTQYCTVTADATNITFVWTYTDSWSSLATTVMINILAVL